ncbi:MAG: hypothetical protein AAB018_03160 [Actinomycetota bacterium]
MSIEIDAIETGIVSVEPILEAFFRDGVEHVGVFRKRQQSMQSEPAE